ncbi:hypothetical protein E2562_021923 [Oryza meyeriana var. granulata]|uniref:Uncharacterized protein n=1 Tax=Oryza meyeriana var. granulata TaxID=110450 RepID=A0A6G1DLI7_9ORYZ|nr:hypothetical protein E2562_021923 [Oryza meyeriana var. granulata]
MVVTLIDTGRTDGRREDDAGDACADNGDDVLTGGAMAPMTFETRVSRAIERYIPKVSIGD